MKWYDKAFTYSIGELERNLNSTHRNSPSNNTDEELSSSGITTIPPLWTFNNISIGHSGVPNQILTSTDQIATDVSTFKVSISENSTLERTNLSSTKSSTTGVHVIQVSSPQISIEEATLLQVSSTQIGITNYPFNQITTTHENSSQIGSSQIDSSQVDLREVSSSQVDISQNHTVKINPWTTILGTGGRPARINQFNSSKVTFPVSVPLQQFFGSYFPNHSLTSNYLTQLQSTFLSDWQLPLNLTLQITDLPTGQLAEAQITQFDQYHRPNGGTILIDDTNGIGWFIDSTAGDNLSESREFIFRQDKTKTRT